MKEYFLTKGWIIVETKRLLYVFKKLVSEEGETFSLINKILIPTHRISTTTTLRDING
jgi:hypothetical protein